MPGLESLRSEHRLIAGVLDALARQGTELEQGATTNPTDLRRLTALLAEFVGIWHHGKEEELLVPELVRHGIGGADSFQDSMREEHMQEEALLQAVEEAVLGKETWSVENRRDAVRAIRALVAFERKHMQMEETSLYAAAEQLLAKDVLRSLDENCRRYERACFGRIAYADLRALAERLGGSPTVAP
jgi:hemerythrin-like domain-containing protein